MSVYIGAEGTPSMLRKANPLRCRGWPAPRQKARYGVTPINTHLHCLTPIDIWIALIYNQRDHLMLIYTSVKWAIL